MPDGSLCHLGPIHQQQPVEGTRVRRGLETKQIFAMAEESMAAWCRGEKTLWKGHGNCLTVDLGKKTDQP